MRTKTLVAVSLVALAALVATGAASAGNGRGHVRQQLRHELRHQIRRDVRRDVRHDLRQARRHVRVHSRHAKLAAGVRYSFLGRLTATPANGGVSITVEGGNRRALRAMLGQPATQPSAYDDSTEFLQWSKGVPTVVQPGQLAAGDYVWLHVRAARGASLGDVEHQAASLVGDHGTQLYRPTQPLFLFRGTIASVGSSSVTLNVTGGNHRAMRLLIGQSTTQTFATGDDTIFLLWQGKVPTVISLSQLKTGDRVVVRIRADQDSTLAQVESSAAKHVGDHEPAGNS